jgi:thiamine-phosphate pyrophosphorylase
MSLEFTPGAMRITQLAAQIARQCESPHVEPAHLLWALLLDESRAAEILNAQGLTAERLAGIFPRPESPDATDESPPVEHPESPVYEAVVFQARVQSASSGAGGEIGSEHLLWGLASVSSPITRLLHAHGLTPEKILQQAEPELVESTEPIPTDIQLAVPPPEVVDQTDTYRVLDAAANRVREGLRVLEDFARFALDDRHLTERLKVWRHQFAETLSRVDQHALLTSRDTLRDVGTTVRTRTEAARGTPLDVVRAAFKRVQEAARTLEEFGKVLSAEFGRQIGELRYDMYTLEKALLLTHAARDRLAGRNLYLLVTEALCPHGSGPVIRAALAAGAGIIQIREKTMSDRDLVAHGRRVRRWTAEAGALFIMNDRPDLAVLTDADGVHVGQEELSVRDARRIVGPGRLVGVSTHTIEQARQAVLDGADYIGVGPVFPSQTKQFGSFAGLQFVREAAGEITLPAFAIGGITTENVAEVLAAGATRIAVSAAICAAEDPGEAARELRRVTSTVLS